MARASGNDRPDQRIDAVQRETPTLGNRKRALDRTNSAGNRSASGGRGGGRDTDCLACGCSSCGANGPD